MARQLLQIGVMVSVLALASLDLTACVIPLPFEETQDAGGPANAPPEILVSSADPSMLEQQTIETGASARIFKVTVRDNDAEDTLYLRVFRNYDVAPDSAVSEITINKPLEGTSDRIFEINTNTWCTGQVGADAIVFEVVVTDRKFRPLDEEPLFRATEPGAGVARSYWIGRCQ